MKTFEEIKSTWINDKSITFKYTKKYLINYGHNLIQDEGIFLGKIYGYGYYEGKEYVLLKEKDKHYAIYLEDIYEAHN
jgi:hypothetical protein